MAPSPRPGRLVVETPEHVDFEYEVAGLVARGLAWAIDAVVLAVLLVLVALVVLLVGWLTRMPHLGPVVVLSAIVLSQPIYFTLVEGWTGGRSPGKKRLRLRVLQDDGRPVAFGAIALRNLLRLADLFPLLYLVGAVSAGLSATGQRLGDRVAGTVVVRDPRPVAPRALEAVGSAGPDAEGPAWPAEFGESLGVVERDLVVQLTLRRHALADDEGRRLLSRTAGLIEGRRGRARPAGVDDAELVARTGGWLLTGGPGAASLGPTEGPARDLVAEGRLAAIGLADHLVAAALVLVAARDGGDDRSLLVAAALVSGLPWIVVGTALAGRSRAARMLQLPLTALLAAGAVVAVVGRSGAATAIGGAGVVGLAVAAILIALFGPRGGRLFGAGYADLVRRTPGLRASPGRLRIGLLVLFAGGLAALVL